MPIAERTRTMAVSIALHAVIVLALYALATGKIMEPPEETTTVEFEFLPPEEPEPEPEPEPEKKRPEPVPKLAIVKRPEVVPEETKVRVVKKTRPFQPKAITESGPVDAPEDTEAIAMPSSPMVFAMTETVGGGSGLEYESTTHGAVGLPPPGPAGGALGSGFVVGAANVKVARDWVITREANPINDRGFEPDYPPLAKRQSREAVIIVKLDIASDGKVVNAVAVSGTEKHGFRAAAVAYARKLRFEPAMAGDTAVASRIEWEVRFYVRN